MVLNLTLILVVVEQQAYWGFCYSWAFGGDFIASSFNKGSASGLCFSVYLYEYSGTMNWEPVALWQLYYVIVYS